MAFSGKSKRQKDSENISYHENVLIETSCVNWFIKQNLYLGAAYHVL